jgi:hypothetical protein
MNKAFTKETEDPGDRCPVCGSLGTTVYQATLRSHLAAADAAKFSDMAYFCPHPTCEVAYFDPLASTVLVTSLRSPLYPKDPNAPICPCFGFTCSEIEADVAEGVVTRVKSHLQRVRSAATNCTVTAADGRCCAAAVQRYFMRMRGE